MKPEEAVTSNVAASTFRSHYGRAEFHKKSRLKSILLPLTKTTGALTVSSRRCRRRRRPCFFSPAPETLRTLAERAAVQRLPHRLPSLPAGALNAYSMRKACAHSRAKASDRVAEVQRAINGPHCAAPA